jgi:hypothetical protein
MMNPCSPQGGRRLVARSLIVTALLGATSILPSTASAATASAAAAGAYHRADVNVISAAKRVIQCDRAHRAADKRCVRLRAGLQAAGVKLSRLEHAVPAAHAANATQLSARQKAPKLTVSGTTLRWNKVADVTAYVLVSKVSGSSDRYSVVTGTSTTPATQPGKTVTFGLRTAIVGSAWATEAKIAYSSTVDRTAAPRLVVDGQTVRWTKVADVTSYATVVKSPGVADDYSRVTGTSFTPTPQPGKTIHVGLRTDVDGSKWADEVAITYPAAGTPAPTAGTTTTSGTGSGSTGSTSTPAPAPAPAPAPSAPTTPSTASNFQVGLVSNSALAVELPYISSLGAKTARMEFDINTPASQLAPYMDSYAKAGIRPLLLAGFQGRSPSTADARNLATWAAAYGPGGTFWQGKSYPAGTAVTNIEFGNESNQAYQYSALASDPNWASSATYADIATQYALGFQQAAQAIAGVNAKVGLLAIGDTPGNWASWMNNVYKAVPHFDSYVAGWVMHPYGPASRWQPNMDSSLAIVASHGAPATIPIFITEYGIATDNGHCLSDNYGWDKCMTYDAAGAALSSTVAAMRARYGSRLAAMYIFQANDQRASGSTTDREGFFGSLTPGGAAKGGYTTAVKSLLAG